MKKILLIPPVLFFLLSFFLLSFFLILFILISESPAIELGLQDCLDLAIKNNQGLKAFEMNILSSHHEVTIAGTHFRPSLKLEGESTCRDASDQFIFEGDALGQGLPPEDIESSLKNQNTSGINLLVEQPLFTGGYLTHSHKKSKIINKQANSRMERERKLLVLAVKTTFYDYLKERSCQEALEKVIEAKEARLSLLKKRVQEGYEKKEDLLHMDTDLAFINLDLHKCKVRGSLALSKLKQLIYYQGDEGDEGYQGHQGNEGDQGDEGYQGDDEISLKGELLPGVFTASLQEAKEAALNHREDLEIALLRAEELRESVEIAKSGFYPQASLTGRYTLQRETNLNRPQIWALGVRIDWPFFEWGKTRAEVMKAEALRQRILFEHEELQRAIMFEVEEAWRAVKEKEVLVEAHEKKLKLAEYKMGLTRDRYSEKTVRLVEMIEMEAELVKSYSEYLAAISELDSELAHLEASISISHDEWFIEKEIYQPTL